MKYAIRIRANNRLEREIAGLLARPRGRPNPKPLIEYKSFFYQAARWKMRWRVVAKVEFHAGESFPRVEFIVTNLQADSRTMVRFYNIRGSGALDQGRNPSGKRDAAELPSIPVQCGAALVESNRSQSGESMATVGATQEDRRFVLDQLAAAVSEDGRPIDQACSLLLVALGREPPDAATVWEDGQAG